MDSKFLILILSFIQTTLCESDGKIVGGQVIDVTSVPYTVSLEYNGHHICGGSIISNKWILSAAHCHQNDSQKFRVRSGTSRKSRGGELHTVEKIIIHPNFSSDTLDCDFMLMKLSTPLVYDEKRQPIELADSYMYYDDAEVLTSGFGATQNPLESSAFLRGVVVKITSNKKCVDAYGKMITTNMFCAGAKNRDSCQGDSGGPIESVYYGALLGVVSYGMACADEKYPGVYAKVSEAKEWIRTVADIK